MYRLIRPILFKLDPETAHSLTLKLIRLAGLFPGIRQAIGAMFRGPVDPVEVFGLTFPNRVGLAAGYDKDGLGLRGLALLGFGHIELGTVTPMPQPGNPRPRIFRLVEDKAIINRMGFPGKGADHLARNLGKRRTTGPVLGVNLGKNKDTPLQDAAGDYSMLVQKFTPLADYLVINVSSPNTVGLRRLQARSALEELLSVVSNERRVQAKLLQKRVPILVKLSPDLDENELEDALQVIVDARMDGVVATNTTVSRTGLRSPLGRDHPWGWGSPTEEGGLSGEPLREMSTQMIRRIQKFTGGKLPVIGVGGVMSAADAQEKLDAGADLVQVYTGLVYAGPGLVKNILYGINC